MGGGLEGRWRREEGVVPTQRENRNLGGGSRDDGWAEVCLQSRDGGLKTSPGRHLGKKLAAVSWTLTLDG